MMSSRTYSSLKSWIVPFKKILHQTLVRTIYSSVRPGTVSPHCKIPDHIVRPSYALPGASVDVNSSVPQDVDIKNATQIEGMRMACKLARHVLHKAGKQLKVGMTTDEVDRFVHDECIICNGYPSPLLYKGFPKSVCTSVNNVACHGIPDDRPVEDGDIINIDVTVYYHGFHGDCSETFLVGDVDEAGRRLVASAQKCRDVGVAACRPGNRFCDIGMAINGLAERLEYNVIPQFCGHGIGEYFHGPPEIVHIPYETEESMQSMKPGMTFTIGKVFASLNMLISYIGTKDKEPIISEGSPTVKILDDGWTAVSVDGSRSAQFEHTVLITETGAEVLTKFYQDEYEEI